MKQRVTKIMMKHFLLLLLLSFLCVKTDAQILNPFTQSRENSDCEIMQIGLTDSLTYVFFKYNNLKINGILCVGEDVVIKDNKTNKKYKLVNSLNIPICPAYHCFNDNVKQHYFSLAFEAIPKNTNEIDIIGNPKGGFNFLGISLEHKSFHADSINYLDLIESTPVKEKGSYLKEGKEIQYFAYDGLIVSMYLSKSDLYGDYYAAFISVTNYSKRRFDFYPENITVSCKLYGKRFDLPILSCDEYVKIVRKKQAWNSFFVELGESLAASNAGHSSSYTNNHSSGNIQSYGRLSGYLGNMYGSVSSNVRSYNNFETNSTTNYYDASANYYASQNASRNIAEFNSVQNNELELINQTYLKANTIFNNQRISGNILIKFKEAETISVTILIKNEKYVFQWGNDSNVPQVFKDNSLHSDSIPPKSVDELLIEKAIQSKNYKESRYQNNDAARIGDIVKYSSTYGDIIIGVILEKSERNKVRIKTYPKQGSLFVAEEKIKDIFKIDY